MSASVANTPVDYDNPLVELTAEIVGAYVSNNPVPPLELPGLISNIHASLAALAAGEQQRPAEEAQKPAVPIRRSVTDSHIVCLEDGKKFKSLKRHLSTHHNMTPDEYRLKWNLPADYPMVAPSYAAARSELAKTMGLGRKRAAEPTPPEAKPAAKKRPARKPAAN